MPKPIDAELVKNTLRNWRGQWDWKQHPLLRLPLRQWSAFEHMPVDDGPVAPITMSYAEYRYETGFLEGRPAARIVGTVPGTDISVECEVYQS